MDKLYRVLWIFNNGTDETFTMTQEQILHVQKSLVSDQVFLKIDRYTDAGVKTMYINKNMIVKMYHDALEDEK